MSDPGSFVAGTIEDILVALAQGIRDAQDRLNMLEPFDEYGRPRPQYYLPQLDFTLKINAIETSSTQTAPGAAQRMMMAPAEGVARGQLSFTAVRAPALQFAVARPSTSSSTTSTNEVYSTISGRFVAVPPSDGMPQIGLTIAAAPHPDGPAKRLITVRAAYASGAPVAGATVEFNVDPGATAALNGLTPPLAINQLALFDSGSAVTDDAGGADAAITLAAVPTSAAQLLIVANLGPVRASLLLGSH
jgi:hypothetical protein